MSAETAVGETGESRCWVLCQAIPAGALSICATIAKSVSASTVFTGCAAGPGDYQATVLRQRLRGAAESIRREVMEWGWHERPVTGPPLRWINQHLPW